MPQRPRPLSPFMNYRWLYTNTLSILHRLTGVLLSIAFLLFVYWLTAAAAGPESHAVALERLASPPGQLLLAGTVLAFVYHLLNGIRHLFFDAGVGFELPTPRRSGWSVVVGTILLTLILCWLLWSRLGAGS